MVVSFPSVDLDIYEFSSFKSQGPDVKYMIALTESLMSTTEHSEITFPNSKCEYYLSKYDGEYNGPNVTVSFLKEQNFSVQMSLQDQKMRVEPVKEAIYINDELKEEEFGYDLVKYKFFVYHQGNHVDGFTDKITWDTDFDKGTSLVMSDCDILMSGIGWLKIPNNSSESDLLRIFEPYKVNEFCVP